MASTDGHVLRTGLATIIGLRRFGDSTNAEARVDVYPFGGAPPMRHKSFRSETELRQFLSERAMHSCFYSTAYWQNRMN